jgi:hypothetical protein
MVCLNSLKWLVYEIFSSSIVHAHSKLEHGTRFVLIATGSGWHWK